MLLIRRLLVIPLGLLLFAVLLSALLSQRLDSTLLSPAFYGFQLSNANFYDFLLTDFLVSAIEGVAGHDADAGTNGADDDLLTNLGISTERIAGSVNTAFSPEWLQGQVETGIEQIVPYVSGDSDEFEIDVNFKNQTEVLLVEMKALQRESKSYEFVLGQFVDPLVEDVLAQETLFGLKIPPERLSETVHAVVTDEWVHDQIDGVIDGVTPYLIGDNDTFTVSIPLDDRAEIAIHQLKQVMRDVDGYDVLYSDLIEAQVLEAVGDSIELPGGLVLNEQEIVSVLRQVVPPGWIEFQAETIIDGGVAYLTGEEEEFSTTISLLETRARAQEAVKSVAARKVLSELESLPGCNKPIISEDIGLSRFDQIPECIPSDVNISALNDLVVELVSGTMDSLILELIPDEVTFTNTDLRETLLVISDEEGLDQFDRTRQTIKDGWVYTDEDLRRDLTEQFSDVGDGSDILASLEGARTLIADGWNYTESDLRRSVGNSGSLGAFDRARNIFQWVSILPWILFPISAALVLGIGFLGGTTWRTRIVWGSGGLTVVSSLIYVTWNMAYNALLKPLLLEFLGVFKVDGPAEDSFSRLQVLLFDKVTEIFESGLDVFASGISNTSVTLLIIGLIAFFVSYFWDSFKDNYEKLSSRIRQAPMRSRAIRS